MPKSKKGVFLSRNKKNNIYPCKHQFYFINVGFKGVKLYRHVFVMIVHILVHFPWECCASSGILENGGPLKPVPGDV